MKYLVCKKQQGVGCDYTIGCGMRFDFIEADSLQSALEKILWPDGLDERSALEGDEALTELLLVPSCHVYTVNLVEELHSICEIKRKRAAQKLEAQERAELKRLKNKYPL